MKNTIQLSLMDYFSDCEQFTLKDAENYIHHEAGMNVKNPSIRARIYEGIDKGIFKRLAKGVYTVTKGNSQCLLINGDGRDLSMLEDNSIDCIITDHPYLLEKSHKGGNRNLALYDCFRYDVEDFKEKYRVLKPGGFLVEFLPERNEVNIDYLNDIIDMARTCNNIKEYGIDIKKPSFEFYAVVPWKKGDFVINQGRKSKNTEDIYFFTKGKARCLKLDNKKNLALAREYDIDVKGKSSGDVAKALIDIGIEPYYMSGTDGMLPTVFDYQSPSKKERIHQAEKPVELLEEIIEFVTLPDEIILDQFAGSGNFGIASLNRNRNSILIEKDEETFEKLKNNIENHIKQ